jgi:hypothetical protein
MKRLHPWRRWGVWGLCIGALTTPIGGAFADPPAPEGESKPASPPSPQAPGSAAPSDAKPALGSPSAARAAKPAEKEAEPEVVLHLIDGRRFTGFLVEKNAKEFIIRIAGIKTPFKADEVARYQVLPPVLERFKELRKAVDDLDVDQMLRLTEWLTERGQLDLALQELDGLLKRVPESATALRARQQLLMRIELRDKARTRPVEGAPPAEPEEPPAKDGPEPRANGGFEAFPYLGPDDINLMKVYEIDLAKPPRLEVPREVIDALLEKHSGHPVLPVSQEGRDAIHRMPAREQLSLLFRVRARELYPKVKVIDQPESMRLFRDSVQRTWLIPSCATNACHGGTDAGRLILSNRRPGMDAPMYTNFYILQNFKLADTTPLIDFANPEKSPLIQMGMPREDVQHRHPPVVRTIPGGGSRDEWRPIFRSADDKRIAETVAWIKALYRPRPDYGITYTPARPFEPGSNEPDPGR